MYEEKDRNNAIIAWLPLIKLEDVQYSRVSVWGRQFHDQWNEYFFSYDTGDVT